MRKNRLAQFFKVNGSYTPKKISAYLRLSLYNKKDYYSFNSLDEAIVIDASNFVRQKETSSLYESEDRIIYNLDAEVSGCTGCGAMKYSSYYWGITNSKPIIEYPIRFKSGKTLSFQVRALISSAGNHTVSIYKDGILSGQETLFANSTWEWMDLSLDILCTDNNVHYIGFNFKPIDTTKDLYIDQIRIANDGNSPSSNPEQNTESGYLTVHAQIYKVDNSDNILSYMGIYDSKSTAGDLLSDGWANFNMNFASLATVETFSDEKYAFVLSVAGSGSKNTVGFDMVDSEDSDVPSAYY